MAKAAWCTDIHLDHTTDDGLETFCQSIIDLGIDVLLLTGDISNSVALNTHLTMLNKKTNCNIMYVLGNHDLWGSSFKEMKESSSNTQEILHLQEGTFSYLTPSQTVICGIDGFYDMRCGNYASTKVRMNDSRFTEELMYASTDSMYSFDWDNLEGLRKFVKQHTKIQTQRFIKSISEFLQEAKDPLTVYILTHVPPFECASVFNGKKTEDDYLPFYVNATLGSALKKLSKKYSQHNFIVLCGHTHSYCDVMITKNLRCKVGEAQYGFPKIQEIFEI